MSNNRISKLNMAKSRLGSAVKRFRQATDLIDEFFKEVLPEQEKPDWNAMPPEYHLLDDCRSSIHGMRQQTLRLLYQILHVKRIEQQRFCSEYEQKGESDPSQNTGAEITADNAIDMLARLLGDAVARDEAKNESDKRYRDTVREAYALIDKIKGA